MARAAGRAPSPLNPTHDDKTTRRPRMLARPSALGFDVGTEFFPVRHEAVSGHDFVYPAGHSEVKVVFLNDRVIAVQTHLQ